MAYKLSIVNPAGTTHLYGLPDNIDYSAEMGEASTLVIRFSAHWTAESAETSGALQANSLVKVLDDSDNVIWRGTVESRGLEQHGGERFIGVYCRDPIGKLDGTVATLSATNNDYTAANQRVLFSRSTPGTTISTATLYAVTGGVGVVKYAYWPAWNTANVWLPTTQVNSTSLGADPGSGGTTIQAGTTSGGMAPSGLIKIENEVIYYDGYMEDASGDWYFHNCKRGQLGSTAAAHGLPQTIYQHVSKKIHPQYPIIVEGQLDDSGGPNDNVWYSIAPGNYTAQIEEGRFDFGGDPADMVPADEDNTTATFDNFRATYGVFDTESANVVYLEADVLTDLLVAPQSAGGPGLAAGEINVPNIVTNGLPVSRVRAPRVMSTMEALRQLLDELGLMRGVDSDAVGIWYDHTNGKVEIGGINQAAAGSQDHSYNHARDITQDISLEDVYSGVVVRYQDAQEFNLLSPDRNWHHAGDGSGGGIGSNSEVPSILKNSDYTGHEWKEQTVYYPNKYNMCGNLLTDRRKDTGWGVHFDNNPGDTVPLLWSWFPSKDPSDADTVAGTWNLKKVKAAFDLRNSSNATNPVDIQIKGITGFTHNGTSAPTSTAIELAGGLNVIYGPDVSLLGNAFTEIQADNIDTECQGLYITADGLPVDNTWFRLKMWNLEAYANPINTVNVYLTDTYNSASDGTLLYAPSSYTKLLNADSRVDQFKMLPIDIGVGSRNTALSLGRLALLQSLRLTQIREYFIDSWDGTIPKLGDTVHMLPDNFLGVVLGINVSWEQGEKGMRLRVLDFNSTLV